LIDREEDEAVDENFNIDVQERITQSSGTAQLPVNSITIGKLENDDVKIYIKQSAYKKIERLASSDTSKELGSILLGEYCESLGKVHVVISEYIEAKYTDASASTLTFTHETWDYVHSEQDKLYPFLKILGWQHTHPNYGIFLSNYDMFIQENFFNMPFQVAYVVDPIQNIRGFFQWKAGKVEKLNGFYIYDDVGTPVKVEQPKLGTTAAVPAKTPVKSVAVMAALLIALMIASSALFVSVNQQISEQRKQQDALQRTIDEQAASIQALQDTRLQDGVGSGNAVQIEELIKQIESQKVILENQEDALTELRRLLNQQENGASTVVFTSYTVQSGDCLSGICSTFHLDYPANIEIIKAINGIRDVNSVYVGQTILLPVSQPSY
jgi:proteasome lid subunit RPN8/RPN11/LysM repeat protein